VRAEDSSTEDYYHLTLRMRAEPSRLEKKYSALAKYAKRLDDVLTGKLRLLDEKGRDLLRASVDSEKLQVTLELYVKDGMLLPFDDSQVYENEPFDPMVEGPRKFSAVATARINMLGIVVNIKNLRGDAIFEAHDSYASATATLTRVPQLKVEGRALGIFSPGFLDIFIPSNIQDITEEFFTVLAKGNNQKGVYGQGAAGAKTAGAPGAISGSLSVEIMDTFLVKLAGGLVAKRLVPDDKVKDASFLLAGDLHDAFKTDFAAFKKRMGR